MAERIVVVGGTRSGKTGVAERLVAAAPVVVYLATATPSDPELAQRIALHRARRPAGWRTVELAPDGAGLVAALRGAGAGAGVLLDALGPWLAARMGALGLWPAAGAASSPLTDAQQAAVRRLRDEIDAFWAAAAAHSGGPVVVVAEEAGAGLLPPDAGARRWLDLLGDLTERLSAAADRLLHVVAGRALGLPPPAAGPAADVAAAAAPPPAAATPDLDDAGAADLRAHGDTMVPAGALDFAVNVIPRPPPHVLAALAGDPADLARYPDDGAARRAVAAYHGRGADEVLVTAGAADAFWLLARVLAVRRAVVAHPSFTEPEAALRAHGVPLRRVLRRPRDGWRLPLAEVPDDADLVVVANPNNPTGTLDDPAALTALCRPGRAVLVDEAFIDFVADAAASLASRGDLPGLVVVRSVTKLWGLAGLRVGYLLAATGVVERARRARQPWAVSGPGLAALQACLADDGWRVRVARAVAAARERLAADLAALDGVTVWPSAANFLLLRVPNGPAAHAALLARGIAVRPSTFPGLDADHLRVAVRDPDDNARLVAALADVLTPARHASR